MKEKYELPEMEILRITEVLTMVSGNQPENSTDWDDWGDIS